MNEAEEERGDSRVEVNIGEPNNQALVVSIVKVTRNERERSISPDWVMYPDATSHQKCRTFEKDEMTGARNVGERHPIEGPIREKRPVF